MRGLGKGNVRAEGGTVVLEKLTQGRGVKNQDEGCMKQLYGNQI